MLEIISPRKTGPTRYDQYLAEGGRQLIVRIALPEDYSAGFPTPDDYAMGTIPKCPVHEHLGPEVAEEIEVTELEEGDITDEEELFAHMKCQEEDLKEQEWKKWEEETRQRELKKKKKEEEEAKKRAAFQKTDEYKKHKEMTKRLNVGMERWSILTNPLPQGFSKVPPKPKETPAVCKPTHRSNEKVLGSSVNLPSLDHHWSVGHEKVPL